MNRFFQALFLLWFFVVKKTVFKINFQKQSWEIGILKEGVILFLKRNLFLPLLGCNNLFGEIRIIDEKINFYSIASTKIGCTEELRQLEEQFVLLLENSTLSFKIEENEAELYNSEKELIFKLYR